MKKALLLLLLLIVVLPLMAGRSKQRKDEVPDNVAWILHDTLWVMGDSTKWSNIAWTSNQAQKCLMVSLDDTSTAGFGSDSACVSIEQYQCWPDYNNRRRVRLYQSKADPDSTGWANVTSYMVADSLDVTSTNADSTILWDRLQYVDTLPNGDTIGYTFDSVLDSVVSDSTIDISGTYYPLLPDASPGLVFKVVGLATNKTGSHTKVILDVYAIDGEPVHTK